MNKWLAKLLGRKKLPITPATSAMVDTVWKEEYRRFPYVLAIRCKHVRHDNWTDWHEAYAYLTIAEREASLAELTKAHSGQCQYRKINYKLEKRSKDRDFYPDWR